jgi:hypothetical protein
MFLGSAAACPAAKFISASQFSQAENTGVPSFEQSFLKRCTTIKVWIVIKEAFGGNAALKKHLYAARAALAGRSANPVAVRDHRRNLSCRSSGMRV